MTLHKIRLELEIDELSGVYTVTSPDVPGLVTEGSTPEEIYRNVQEALEGLLEVWSDLGQDPPPVLQNRQAQSVRMADVLVAV